MIMCAFTAGTSILKGHFFLRDNLIDMTYKLDQKKVALVFPGTVRYVCSELIERGRGRKKFIKLPGMSMKTLLLHCNINEQMFDEHKLIISFNCLDKDIPKCAICYLKVYKMY